VVRAMYNLIVLCLAITIYVLHARYLSKRIHLPWLAALMSTSISMLVCLVGTMFLFFEGIVFVILAIASLFSILIFALFESDVPTMKEHTNQILSLSVKTIVIVTIFGFIPLHMLAWFGLGRQLYILLPVYLIGVLIYQIYVAKKVMKLPNPLIVIGLYLFLGALVNDLPVYKLNNLYSYFGTTREQLRLDYSYQTELEFEREDILLNAFRSDPEQFYIHNGRYYQFHYHTEIEYQQRYNVLTVYDLETGELEYQDVVRSGDNNDRLGDFSIRENHGHGLQFVGDTVYITSKEYLFRYRDGMIDLIHQGSDMRFFQEDGFLYLIDNGGLYQYDGRDLTLIEQDEDKYDDVSIYNNTVVKRYYGTDPHYVIEDTRYIVEELYYVSENIVVGGNIAEAYVFKDGETPREIPKASTSNIFSCGEYYYTYWKAGIIINDFPKSSVFRMDQEMNIIDFQMVDGIYAISCSEDQLYAMRSTYTKEGYIDGYELISIETWEEDRPWYHEFQVMYATTGLFLWFVLFALYPLKEEE
jgi:hypothetical protein